MDNRSSFPARSNSDVVALTTSSARGRGRSRVRVRGRAATMLEYALVLSAVVLPSIAGVAIAGAKLFHDYRATRDHVVRSTP